MKKRPLIERQLHEIAEAADAERLTPDEAVAQMIDVNCAWAERVKSFAVAYRNSWVLWSRRPNRPPLQITFPAAQFARACFARAQPFAHARSAPLLRLRCGSTARREH
jgi:hypothetical protein